MLFAVFLFGLPPIAGAQSRLPVTISNTALPATTLTDYTVRLDLNAVNAPGFDFTNNGDDLMAWDSTTTTQLNFYVEEVDSVAETAIVWVRVPSVPPSPPTTQIFLDYNRENISSPLSNASNTFVNEGFKYHSQPHTGTAPGPESRTAGEAEFNFDEVTSNPNYGCTDLTEINDDHSSVFTQNGDFALSIQSQIIVPADALYEFRAGVDFGNGGELYIDGNSLEDDWDGELWWALNFSNADVLTGSALLTAGSHTLNLLGYERCCDGAAEIEYRYDSDGDGSLADETFTRLTTTSPGITLLAPSCPVAELTLGPLTTVPVTLAKFDSNKIGPFIKLDWETADETFNAGFNIWSLVQENNKESLLQLNRELIRSHFIDSIDTQKYSWRFNTKSKEKINNVVISSVDINGVEEFFGPFEIGETYGQSFKPQAINWQRVKREYEQSMQARGFTKVRHKWKKLKSNARHSAQAQIGIESSGVYRVTYEELRSEGIDWNGIKSREIAVSLNGKAIPRAIWGARKGIFGPGSAINFVGLGPDNELSIYESQRYYKIARDRELVLPVRTVKRKPRSVQDWHNEQQVLADDNRHLAYSPLKSPWIMDMLYRSAQPVSKDYHFQLPEIVEGQAGSLDITLGGITSLALQDFDGDGAMDPHHVISILVNGQTVQTIRFYGQNEHSESIEIPAGLLLEGQNIVTARVENNGYRFDAIAIDSISVNYPVANTPSGAMMLNAQSGVTEGVLFPLKQGRGLIAYAYRQDHNLVRLKPRRSGRKKGHYEVPFTAANDSQYYIGQQHALNTPASIQALGKPEVIALTDTDLLIISHPSFIGEALHNYAQERYLQGVQSHIISTDKIAASIGSDIPLHIAIQRFLKAASQQIEYKHVLIVGGHTFDYLGRQNKDSVNFIPAFYRPIGFSRFTPTDQPFVDFDGDGFPEKTVGRWPVRELSQVAIIAQKSLAWANKEAERTEVGHGVLLLADKTREFDFSADLETHFQKMSGINVADTQRIYVDDFESDSLELNKHVQQQVMAGFNQSKSLVFYNGHGSPSTWSFTQMLASSRVPELANEHSPVLITSLGCYTTYYENPSHDSLALKLMFAGNNGAVAIHGPSVVGAYRNQLALSNFIADEMKTGRTLGESIRLGMRRLPVNYRTAITNWALLGDPSLPVQ